jgi:glycosyltransferase involved in cell wall biosynthesis
MKEVSVIVPTINSKNDVRVLCESMKRLGLDKKAEFIFVDSNSKDGTLEVLKEYNVTVISLNNIVSKGKARNIGYKASTGDIIAELDADIELVDGWYDELLNTMNYADIAAGYACIPGNWALPRVSVFVNGQDITYPCCNIAYKRKVFEKIGLFDEAQGQAEDIELNYRAVLAGHSIVYNPKMLLIHHQRTTRRGFLRQAFWNGEARYELHMLHPELLSKTQHGVSIKSWIRLGFGVLGYSFGRFYKRPGERVQRVGGERNGKENIE